MSIQDKWVELGYKLVVNSDSVDIYQDSGVWVFSISNDDYTISFIGYNACTLKEAKLLIETIELLKCLT